MSHVIMHPAARRRMALRPSRPAPLTPRTLVAWLRAWIEARRLRRELRRLGPRLMRDIGVSEPDIARIVPSVETEWERLNARR